MWTWSTMASNVTMPQFFGIRTTRCICTDQSTVTGCLVRNKRIEVHVEDNLNSGKNLGKMKRGAKLRSFDLEEKEKFLRTCPCKVSDRFQRKYHFLNLFEGWNVAAPCGWRGWKSKGLWILYKRLKVYSSWDGLKPKLNWWSGDKRYKEIISISKYLLLYC